MFSDPVVGDRFFGRNKTLSLLSKRINGLKDGYRQNIAIIGPKLIGKSSLILHFFSSFTHPQVIPIYIDARPNAFNHFVYKFLGALLYHYLKNKQALVTEELESLKKCAQKTIPKTVAAILDIENCVRDAQLDQAYERLLDLTSIFKKESGISCVLILDEFHILDSYKIKQPFLTFAKEIMMQKDTMYLLISSQVSYAKKVLANELSLLFGNFETIHLEPFDYSTSCKFLERRFQNINLPDNFRDFLINFSNRHPFYLDILSNKLKEKAKELNRMEVNVKLISQAFNSLIYDSQGILNQYFTNLLSHSLNGADYSNFMPILLSACTKAGYLSQLVKATNLQSRILAKQINQLLDNDLLSKVGIFYRIQDKIFRFWLKSVYQRKNLSLAQDPATESKDFSKEIEDRLFAFSQASKKRLIERIIELFKSFDNEMITIQNKSFKFCQFNEVCPWPAVGLPDCIIARYPSGYWSCLVGQEQIDEARIQAFFSACRNSKYKIRKSIIIATKQLDLNARLLALEKKIWIWSITDLNLLLDLYGQEQVVS